MSVCKLDEIRLEYGKVGASMCRFDVIRLDYIKLE